MGIDAGSLLTIGSYNIDIGHPKVAKQAKTIRIGKAGTPMKTYLTNKTINRWAKPVQPG